MLGEGAKRLEIWDVLDGEGNPTGGTMIRGTEIAPNEYHLVVHIWIVNHCGSLLIQQRNPDLKLMPGIWAATGGSVLAGESSIQAARRELYEELGIAAADGQFQFIDRLKRRNSYCDLWLLHCEEQVRNLRLQAEEVADARWVSMEQLEDMVEHEQFHDYGMVYFHRVHNALNR